MSGGRLIRLDKDTRRITYIAPKIQRIIEDKGWDIHIGTTADEALLKPLLVQMTEVLEESVGLCKNNPYYEMMITNQGIDLSREITCISFSGGVADAVYHPEKFRDPFLFGDIGVLLGRSIREYKIISGSAGDRECGDDPCHSGGSGKSYHRDKRQHHHLHKRIVSREEPSRSEIK